MHHGNGRCKATACDWALMVCNNFTLKHICLQMSETVYAACRDACAVYADMHALLHTQKAGTCLPRNCEKQVCSQ